MLTFLNQTMLGPVNIFWGTYFSGELILLGHLFSSTVNNKKCSNPEYWGKFPRMFKLFHKFSKMENEEYFKYSDLIQKKYSHHLYRTY